MVKMEFEGKTYTLQKNSWIDSHNSIESGVQTELFKRYFLSLRLECMTVKALTDHADLFMNIDRFDFAEKCCREAVSRPDVDIDSLEFIYPRLTSCLRKLGRPREAVEIISSIKHKYGMKMITPVLLISVAAAYCDLNEFDNAKCCADLAYRKLNRNPSEELRLVYKRIRKHTGK